MTEQELLRTLLEDIEETFEAEGMLPLYNFAWSLRGILSSIAPDRIEPISQVAYDDFTSRHDVRLVWDLWPLRLVDARPAAPGTTLDFDLDPEGDVSKPMLVLVPA